MLIQNILSYDDFTYYLENYKYIFVNVYATWCKPCKVIKPLIEQFVSTIDKNEYIYLKINSDILDKYIDFTDFFIINKLPYFAFIKNKKTDTHFEPGDFLVVSKKIHLLITTDDDIENKRLTDNFKLDNDF